MKVTKRYNRDYKLFIYEFEEKTPHFTFFECLSFDTERCEDSIEQIRLQCSTQCNKWRKIYKKLGSANVSRLMREYQTKERYAPEKVFLSWLENKISILREDIKIEELFSF